MKIDKQNVFLIAFFGVVGVAVAFAFVAVISSFVAPSQQQPVQQSQQQSMPRMARMSLSPFDREMAMQFMDMNGDGMCDACGMPVEMCMDSGQLQCNMDPKSTIGVLGSQHIHADLKIYLKGKALDEEFFRPIARDIQLKSSNITSSFIHVESSPSEKIGDVLHMHATGVPLWIFFDSIGLELPNAKAYVNGQEIHDYRNYVFNDLDKILITDGTGSLDEQLASITDFAKNH